MDLFNKFQVTSTGYLQFAFAISLFRVFMYTFFTEYVAKVKADPVFWKKKSIQEMMGFFTGALRTLMLFRALIFGWGAWILEGEIYKRQLVYISVAFDGYIMYTIVNWLLVKKNVVMKHQDPYTPLTIQAVLLLGGLIVAYKLQL